MRMDAGGAPDVLKRFYPRDKAARAFYGRSDRQNSPYFGLLSPSQRYLKIFR
jgi:hypothetical protein